MNFKKSTFSPYKAETVGLDAAKSSKTRETVTGTSACRRSRVTCIAL